MKNNIIFLSILLALTGCSEFLAIDLADTVLIINSPADSLYTAESSHSFWWEPDDRAELYHLQLITPEFGQSPYLLVDTFLAGNSLNITLGEGRYAWRVRIENTGSVSDWQYRSLTIDQTAPQQAIALNPLSGDTLNSDKTTLRWLSPDFELEGRIAPTADSIYLIDSQQNTARILTALRIDFEEEKAVDIAEFFPVDSSVFAKKYYWKVVSEDPAGNRNSGVTFNFWWP